MDILSTPPKGTVQALASLLQILKFQEPLLQDWIGALLSDEFTSGSEMLRTADDEFDAFGVLAVLHSASWKWNELDQGWAVEDSAYALPPRLIATWLGSPLQQPQEHIARFQDCLFQAAEDGATLNDIGDLLQQAVTRTVVQIEAMDRTRRRNYIGAGLSDTERTALYGGWR